MYARNFFKLHNLIEDNYTHDYNILTLHQKIQSELASETRFIPQLQRHKQELDARLEKRQTFINRERLLKEANEIAGMIDVIQNRKRLHDYISSTKECLASYESLSSNVVFVSFWEEDKTYQEPDYKKLALIEKYLGIAGKFYPLQITHRCKFKSGTCKNCGVDLIKDHITPDGIIFCQECETEHFTTINSHLSKEGNLTVNSDESKENFYRALVRFEGMQAEKPCSELFIDLDKYFLSLGRPSGEEIKRYPLNSDGTRGDTDHQMLWSALSKINWTQYYEDTNLIGHIYWGWALPQITPEQKSKILEHYDKTQYVFHQIPVDERVRVSSLGTQYRLFRHLQLVGYPCTMKQFKIAENSDSLRIHDRLWQKMCLGTGDPEIYFIL